MGDTCCGGVGVDGIGVGWWMEGGVSGGGGLGDFKEMNTLKCGSQFYGTSWKM